MALPAAWEAGEALASVLLGLVRRRPAGLQHLLHQVEAHARLTLVLGDGEVVEEVKVTHVGAVRVPVLVDEPFPLGGVGVARADVLGLQVLQLAMDGVPVRHLAALLGASRSGRRPEATALGAPLPQLQHKNSKQACSVLLQSNCTHFTLELLSPSQLLPLTQGLGYVPCWTQSLNRFVFSTKSYKTKSTIYL